MQSYVAFTDDERMIGDAEKNRIMMTLKNMVVDLLLSANASLFILSPLTMKCLSFDVSIAMETSR